MQDSYHQPLGPYLEDFPYGLVGKVLPRQMHFTNDAVCCGFCSYLAGLKFYDWNQRSIIQSFLCVCVCALLSPASGSIHTARSSTCNTAQPPSSAASHYSLSLLCFKCLFKAGAFTSNLTSAFHLFEQHKTGHLDNVLSVLECPMRLPIWN